MVTQTDVTTEALSWVGTPYLHLGRTKGLGVDCIGLILEVTKALGLSWQGYEDTPYQRIPGSRLRRDLVEHTETVWDGGITPLRKPLLLAQEGDIAAVAWNKYPMHAGFLTKTPMAWYLIHAYSLPYKVVHHRVDDQWLSRLKSLHRLREFVT